jgi:hypothetical protein
VCTVRVWLGRPEQGTVMTVLTRHCNLAERIRAGALITEPCPEGYCVISPTSSRLPAHVVAK